MENDFTLQDRFAVENKVFDDAREGIINLSECSILLFITRQCCLTKSDSVELSCGFLAKQLNVTKRYMTKIEKSLEEKGYITVTHNSKDKLNLPNTITIVKSSVQNNPTVQKDTTVLNDGTEQNNPTVQNEGSSSELNEGSSSELNDPHNKIIEDNNKEIIATSDSRYTGNASVVKNETTVTSTTEESKKIFDWVKKTLDKGKELMSKYRDSHTREEADKLWSEITKLTSLMKKAIGKNKLTDKQSEMLQEFIAKASRANEAKEKYLSKVSEGKSFEYETTAGTIVTSTTEDSSYHPDGNGYCNGKFIECEFETKNGTSGKIEMTNKSVGEMLYKLHKLSGKEKSDYQLHVDELVKAYCPEKTTPRNGYEHLTSILAEKGEEEFLSMLKSIGVEIEEDVEADEIEESPNEVNLTSETTVTEPSKNKERAHGEDDFDHFTKGTEEKTSLRDNSRRLDFDNPPF